MSDDRINSNRADIDPGDCDRLASTSVNDYTSISAVWLANILAVSCLWFTYHSEVDLGKPWRVPEWVLCLIAGPYGGIAIKKVLNGRGK